MENGDLRKRKFDYSWVILALCFLMVFVSLGFCSSGRTLYLTAITGALNIPRGAFSLNDTIRFVTTTIMNLFFGSLVYKFGTKKLICAGFICLIGFTMINATAKSLYAFYVGGVLLGIGLSWTSTTMVSTIVNKWCTKNKGTITGALLAANGVGGAIAVQIVSPIIFQEGNAFGYRDSYRLVTLFLFITLALIIIFYRENPKGSDGTPTVVSGKKRKARGTGWVGIEYSEAIKKPYFYITAASIFLTGMVLQGLSGMSVPYMYDIGMDIEFVALLTSMGGILLSLAKFSTGFLYDRFGLRISMNICLISSFISMALLLMLSNSPLGKSLAFIRAVIGSLALPLETVMLPLYASDLFGNKSFDKFVGIFVSVNYAGYALGAPLGNICYDIFGNYKLAFLIFSVLMLVVTIAQQFSLTMANRDRKKILEAESLHIEENSANLTV